MKLENSIRWCDATTNAVTGCDKVSPGCKNCFAAVGTRARVLRAQGIETWGAHGVRQPVDFEPVFRRLNKLCVCDNCAHAQPFEMCGEECRRPDIGATERDMCCAGKLRRIRLFADSNSDWLDPKWPVETLARFLDAIRLAPNVDVILLTKRIENWRARLGDVAIWYEPLPSGNAMYAWIWEWIKGNPPPNLWLGVSVEDQKRADERIPLLLKTPAAVRFLSVEPLLEEINIKPWLPRWDQSASINNLVQWVIVGGESGAGRRDCGVEAIVSVAEQCVAAGVPIYVKQDCHRLPGQQGRIPDAWWNRKEFPKIYANQH